MAKTESSHDMLIIAAMKPITRNGSRAITCRVFVMQNCTIMTSLVMRDMTSPLRCSLKKPTFMPMTWLKRSLRSRWRVRVRMFSMVQAPR